MFEQIHIPALFMANQATLSLCASGRTSGVVIDAGYDVTRIVPIYEMCSLPYATRCLDFGGNHLTQYLKKILMEKGCNPKSIGWLNLGRKKITAGIETLIDSFTKRLMHAQWRSQGLSHSESQNEKENKKILRKNKKN